MSETTTDTLAEIEGQAADYTPPKGWRVLQDCEVLQDGDQIVQLDDGKRNPTYLVGCTVGAGQRYIRRIESEPEPQPVQIREGRWRTRGGEIRHITPTPTYRSNADRFPWHDAHYNQTWLPSGHYHFGGDSPFDLLEYLGPIEPEPQPEGSCPQLHPWLRTPPEQQVDRIITPDDVAAEALAGVRDKAKAEQEIAELRSEVSYVQRLLGEEKRRFAELETLTSDLRAVNAATEKAVNSAARDKADLQHRLDTVAAEWAVQAETIRGLQTQLEAVKAELSQVSRDRYLLQIELDAREQVPEAVSDRFDQGFEQGTARAVETIAEWLEPLRKGNCTLRAAVLFHLPAIMRSLTGLADTED